MKDFLLWFILFIAVILIIVIILQPKSSSGMGSMSGQDTDALTTKRGGERFLHVFTVSLVTLFVSSVFIYHII
jgi:protein translocase SecG subunit